MAYLVSIQTQAAIFCKTVGFGFLLGAFYDLVRLLRLPVGARRIAAWDVGFGAPAGTAAFLFALTQNGGKVRLYLLAAIGVGFALWYFCAGAPVRAATDGILRLFRRAVSHLRRTAARLSSRLEKTAEKLCAPLKKLIKKSKILLKSCRAMVYNSKR